MIKVCLSGVTGWTGSCIAKAILRGSEFELVSCVARKTAGRPVGDVLSLGIGGPTIVDTVEEALKARPQILIDYTAPDVVKKHIDLALEKKVGVVVGTSGLTAEDYELIDTQARTQGVGVFAAGNFSLTAALVKRFSLMAAKYVPHWEVIDYTHAEKVDAPSGTARELAEKLSEVAKNEIAHPVENTIGQKEARGAQVGGTPVHSIRLPSFIFSYEALFGLPDERLTIRHDAGSGAEPYVAGTLLAAKEVVNMKGLKRGMDSLLQ